MSSILYMKGRGIQLSDFVVVVGGVSNPDLSSSAGKVDVGIFSVFSASSVPSAIPHAFCVLHALQPIGKL